MEPTREGPEPVPDSNRDQSTPNRTQAEAAPARRDAEDSLYSVDKMRRNTTDDEELVLAEQAGLTAAQLFEIEVTFERLEYRRLFVGVLVGLAGAAAVYSCTMFVVSLLRTGIHAGTATPAEYASLAAFASTVLFFLGNALLRTNALVRMLRRVFHEQRNALADLDASGYFVEHRLLERMQEIDTLSEKLRHGFSDGSAAKRA
jgi:hypothetical protein